MKILFDQGVPAPLRRALTAHVVETAYEKGWHDLQNGALLTAAEDNGFDVLVTTDRNLRYQQNLKTRRIGIVVLSTTDWRRISHHTDDVIRALDAFSASGYIEIAIPND